MSAPAVSTSYPLNGASDVFINKSLTVTFTASVTGVTDNTVFLVDVATSNRVLTSLTIAASTSDTDFGGSLDAIVTIVPLGHLRENTAYRIVLVGQDAAVGTEYLTDTATGDPLTTSIAIEFETGDSAYSIDTTVEKEAQDFTLEGDLNLASNIKALGYDFTLVRVRPANHSHAVPLNLTGDNTIRFIFNQSLATGLPATELATVNLYPILDDSSYLGTASAGLGGSIPSYSGYLSGNQLVYHFSGGLPNNLAINIQLNDSISGSNGATFGGHTNYIATTKLYPEIFGVNAVKLELKSLNPELHDDYIGAVLFKNSIMLWEKLGRGYNLDGPPWAAKKYVLYATVLDIIEDQEYEKFLSAGTRKQVADMNLGVDNMIGRLAMKVASATKARDIALETLKAGWQFKSVIRAEGVAASINDSRMWFNPNGSYTEPYSRYIQSSDPNANVKINRNAKTNNPLDYGTIF
jgi:hypothetical protein